MKKKTKPKQKPKCVIYTRFSPRRNAGESESCETQEAYCRRHAGRRGMEVKAVHHDRAISGKEEDRPNLWGSIDELRKGDVLVCWKWDRLARNVYLTECIKRAVAKQGARIEVVEGDVEGDGPEQEMIRQVLAAFAEYERKVVSARTKYAMKYHQSNGRRVGRFAPYGVQAGPEQRREADPRRKGAGSSCSH